MKENVRIDYLLFTDDVTILTNDIETAEKRVEELQRVTEITVMRRQCP